MSGLTARQEQFCREYIIDLNATQAAIRAGYSETTAKETEYENLTKPHIKTRIEELKQDRLLRFSGERKANETELETDADRVIRELRTIAFASSLDFCDMIDGEFRIKPDVVIGENAGAILRLSVLPNSTKGSDTIIHLSFQHKLKAIGMLMEHYGMVKTKTTPPPRTRIHVVSTYENPAHSEDIEQTVE